MRIAHFITSVGYGGGEQVCYELLKHLQKTDEVSVYNLSRSDIFSENIEKIQVPYFSLTNYDLKKPKMINYIHILILSLPKIFFLAKKVKNVEVIHSHGFPDNILALMCKLKYPRIKIIYTHHTLMGNKSFLSKIIFNQIYSYFNKITVVSELAKTFFLKNHSKVTIEVIPNWVNDHFYKENQGEMKAKEIRLVSIGRIEKIKEYELAIDYLIAKFPINSSLTFIGEGSCKEELIKYANSKEVGNRVRIISYIKNSELFEEIKKYNGAIFLGRNEGFCIAAAESYVADLRIYSDSKAITINSILDGDVVLLDQIINEKELTNDLLNFKKNNLLIKNKFKKDNILKEYTNLYCEILK